MRFLKIGLALLALGIGAGTMHAASLVATPTSITLACNTATGPTAGTVGIKLATGASAATVTVTATAGAPVVLPAPAVVNSTTVATNFSISVAAGCKGATNGQVVTLTFTPNTGLALTLSATLSVTSTSTALVASPSLASISCTKNGAVYTPGPAQTVNVTSAANLGTPFTVDNTTNVLPSWLQVTPLTGGTASSSAVALSVVAKSGCGGLPAGTVSFVVHLLNAPAPDKTFTVQMTVGGASPLSSSVSTVSLTYVKGSGTYNSASTNLTASPNVFVTVDPSTLPVWLNASPATGTTPVALAFAPTAGAETLTVGTYTASVHLKVSGDLDFVQPVKLLVENPAATLSVSEGTTRNVNWTLGTALPTLIVTPVSSDSPISFTVTTTAGTLSPQVSATSGLAYNFGSPITVTFLQSIFAAAAPGTILSGHVIITPASGSPIDVTISVTVQSPGATISTITPASLPTASSGTFTVALSGSGFVVSGDPTIATTVGVVNGGFIVPDANITANVLNSNSIAVVITATTSDAYLPFSGNGGTVTLGVCNPQGTSCKSPTGTITLTIGVNPIIQAITSASSFIQPTSPALLAVAPYDILSIFGENFCVSNGTGCLGANAALYPSLDPLTQRYLTTLSPDPSGSGQRFLTVTFQTHSATPTVIATAPLLFASNTQINLVVPDLVKNYVGNTVDVVVSFGYGTGSTLLSSAPYSLTGAASDPGVFTLSGAGQGDVAALAADYSVISTTNPAGARSTGTDSDTIQLYVTGLGRPDSSNSGSGGYSATCMSPDTYFAAVNSATSSALTSDDGLVLQAGLFPSGQIQPCMDTTGTLVPTVTIGGAPATVTYAGWAAGSIAGLYQINVQMPASTATVTDESGASGTIGGTALHLPVVVTSNSVTSQASGADLWVVQRLKVAASGATSGTHGNVWGGTTITATEGTSTYTYAVTTGTLPAGLTLTGSTGVIAGTPTTAGTSTVVITATDSASPAVTGTVSVTFTIN